MPGVAAEAQADVARRRASGDYPPALLERLRVGFHPDEGLEPPEAAVHIESARPLTSSAPLVGGMIVLGQRVARRLLSWYVAPIARDQTRFNVAILRELRTLERRLDRLETPADSEHPPRRSGGAARGKR